MPETAIDKDGYLLCGQDYVGRAGQRWIMTSVTNTARSQQLL